MGPSTPGSVQAHLRRPSEYSAVERFKLNQMEHDSRRNSMPSRLRTASVSSSDQDPGFSATESWSQSIGSSATSSSPAPEAKRTPESAGGDRAVVCLIAEDNPISAKILETLLVRLGCRCILAADGAEAISTAHGDISEWPNSSPFFFSNKLHRVRPHFNGLSYAGCRWRISCSIYQKY